MWILKPLKSLKHPFGETRRVGSSFLNKPTHSQNSYYMYNVLIINMGTYNVFIFLYKIYKSIIKR